MRIFYRFFIKLAVTYLAFKYAFDCRIVLQKSKLSKFDSSLLTRVEDEYLSEVDVWDW
jgi:hypothetical protein